MPKIKACIFDLDGVIVDTAKYHYLAWKRLGEQLGFNLTPEDNEELKGVSREESLEIILRKAEVELPDDEKKELMDRKNEWYLDYVEKMSSKEILPGVINFLDEVKDSKRKIALGSSSKNSMRILQKIGIVDYFDAIIDGTKISKGKPDPQIFTLGAEALDVYPGYCVVFEDAPAGVEAAHAAGMYIVGVGDEKVLSRANLVIAGFEKIDTALFDKL